MTSKTPKLRARLMLCAALGMVALIATNAPRMVDAQGLVKGVEEGARQGTKAAGPVGGVLGGAIGGEVGVVTGVTDALTGKSGQPVANDKANDKGKAAKTAKATTANNPKAGKPIQVLTQQGAPQLTAEQIVANSDAYIERIKAELNLTPEQEKSWSSF